MTDKAEQHYHLGDLVAIRSGGPKMTVREVAERDNGEVFEYLCVWMEGSMMYNAKLYQWELTGVDSTLR